MAPMVNMSGRKRQTILALMLSCCILSLHISAFAFQGHPYRHAKNAHRCTSSTHHLPPHTSTICFHDSKDNFDNIDTERTVASNENNRVISNVPFPRRTILTALAAAAATIPPTMAKAAPPMAVIAEELGYFPVTNRKGETVMVPKRVSRQSTQQAIELAQHLKKSGVVMYGAYWCPHCARQKELFGREAWDEVPYIECSPKGYGANAKLCIRKNVDGYPMWIMGDKSVVSGEVDLVALAKASKYPGTFHPDEEPNVPPPLGSKACK